MARKKPRIHIKKSKQGALRAHTGTPKGKNIPVSTLRYLAKHGTPERRKQAQFALNARRWKNK